MFEIGKWYRIEERSFDEETSGHWQVVGWDAPLLKLHNPNHGGDRVVNTNSPGFHCAEMADDPEPVEMDLAGVKLQSITPATKPEERNRWTTRNERIARTRRS